MSDGKSPSGSKRKALKARVDNVKAAQRIASLRVGKGRDVWIRKAVRLTNPYDEYFLRTGVVEKCCGKWYVVRLSNAKAVMESQVRIKQKPCNFELVIKKSP